MRAMRIPALHSRARRVSAGASLLATGRFMGRASKSSAYRFRGQTMTIRVKIDGGARLRKRLKRASTIAEREVKRAILVSGLEMQGEIQTSIQTPKSGRIYTTNFFTDGANKVRPIGTRPPHQASAPGEAPAWDTGALAGSIFAELDGNGPRIGANIGTDLKYGQWLEDGTTKMEARPWLAPAFNRLKGRTTQRVAQAVRKALREASR